MSNPEVTDAPVASTAPADAAVEPAVPTATTTAAAAEPAAKPEAPADAGTTAEPQNALTKKFTEAEWTALKELRVRVLGAAAV